MPGAISPLIRRSVIYHGGLPAEAEIEEGRLRLLALVLLLVAEVGEETPGGSGVGPMVLRSPGCTTVDTVAAALAVDLGQRGVRVLALQVLLVERVLPVVVLLLEVLLVGLRMLLLVVQKLLVMLCVGAAVAM